MAPLPNRRISRLQNVHGIQASREIFATVFAYASYNLLFVNYGAFATFLTSYVVFILTLAGLPVRALTLHRVLCTVIGGALVMLVYGAGALLQRRMQGEEQRAPAEKKTRSEERVSRKLRDHYFSFPRSSKNRASDSIPR